MAPPPEPDTIDVALTLTQPWAGLVASGIKRIENRPWKLPKRMLGRRFAIHASREVDQEIYQRLEAMGFAPSPLWTVTSAIIGVARVIHCVSSLVELQHEIHGHIGPEQEQFWIGPHAFILESIQSIATPVECKGALGFWGLSESLATRVTAQLAEDA